MFDSAIRASGMPALLLLVACGRETAVEAPAPAATALTLESATSAAICRLEGGSASHPGVYGTDLGFTFAVPSEDASSQRLAVLFGDTWISPTSVCDYPPRRSDDLQVYLPVARPSVLGPGTSVPDSARAVCGLIEEPPPDARDPSTPRPLRLFPDAGERTDDKVIYMDFNRTPVAAFSDTAHSFAVFVRTEIERCDTNADCGGSFVCTNDPGYSGRPLGVCDPPLGLSLDPEPAYCRPDIGGKGDCGLYRTCSAARGVCRSREPFVFDGPGGPVSPTWYDDDPRFAMAQTMYIASAAWPDRPEDYATGARFVTNKFSNPSVRTVKRFDPDDPMKSDYRPGSGALFMWGRPSFWGRQGFQPLMFFLYQPLDGFLSASGEIRWEPRFFAGYDADGKPRWSADEADAVPVYGAEAAVGADGGPGAAPEFDLVNQMSLSWVEPLGRWVMLYGGDLPRWLLYDPATDTELAPVNVEPAPGAIHLRHASHPWGRSTARAPATEAWSSALPVLTREDAAAYLGCEDQSPMLPGCDPNHDPHRPLQMILTIDAMTSIAPSDYASITKSCIDGDATRNLQYKLSGDGSGHLYGPNIIETWTDDVSASVKGLAPGGRAVDLYFNVSTWNPYGVALMKTEVVASPSR